MVLQSHNTVNTVINTLNALINTLNAVINRTELQYTRLDATLLINIKLPGSIELIMLQSRRLGARTAVRQWQK